MNPQMYTHIREHTYHKDEGPKTLCQGLAEQQVPDLEKPGQFVQIHLLSAHVFLREADETARRQALVGGIRLSWAVEWSWEDRGSSYRAQMGLDWGRCRAWARPHPLHHASLLVTVWFTLPGSLTGLPSHFLSLALSLTRVHLLYTTIPVSYFTDLTITLLTQCICNLILQPPQHMYT